MRHPRFSPRLVWFIVVLLLLGGPGSVLADQEATPQATPPSPPVPPGFNSEALAAVAVEAEPGEVVGYFISVALTLDPGTVEPQAHLHPGTLFLTVVSGSACFLHSGLVDPDATVTARVPASAEPESGACGNATRDDCSGPDGCVLASGEVVELPAGSSIVQTGAARHSMWNADSMNEAVMHLSGFSPPPDGAPCVGGCWGW